MNSQTLPSLSPHEGVRQIVFFNPDASSCKLLNATTLQTDQAFIDGAMIQAGVDGLRVTRIEQGHLPGQQYWYTVPFREDGSGGNWHPLARLLGTAIRVLGPLLTAQDGQENGSLPHETNVYLVRQHGSLPKSLQPHYSVPAEGNIAEALERIVLKLFNSGLCCIEETAFEGGDVVWYVDAIFDGEAG